MKFISYDGDWPNLCRGTLVVEKDGNQYSIYGALISGGWCGFDPDGEDQVEEGPWIIDPDELPNELKNDNDIAELEELANTNVPHGCCGGCLQGDWKEQNMMTNEERMKIVNNIDDILGDWTNSGDDFYLQQAIAAIRAAIEKEVEHE